MANKTAKSTDEIQQLLDERRKVLQWLDRLNMAGADTPSEVRERVRSDYESRLTSVADELKGFTEELQETLATHQAQQAELADAQTAAETRMAEAKLRHAVGEFPESKWNDIHSDILSELVNVREELKATEEEITRLEEVLGMIQAPSASSSAPPPRVEPTPSPPPSSSRTSGSHERFDELAFLKSVTEDERQGPAASRAHGPEKPTHEPIRSVRVSQEQPAIPEPQDGRDSSAGPKKTLKCGECGVMNFPTEWYCERCGAELAAL